MKSDIIYLLLSILFFVSCGQEEVGNPFQKGQEVILNASFAGSDGELSDRQRIVGRDAGDRIDLVWNEGDQIYVIIGNDSAIFTLTEGAHTSSACFKGIMPADGMNYHVRYPVVEANIAKQQYVDKGFARGLMRMSTKIEGTLEDGFVLSADDALIGLQLTGIHTISDIVLTNPADGSTYTLDNIHVTLDKEHVQLFYFVVPAGTWQKGFIVDVYAGEFHIKRLTKNGPVTFSSLEAMIMDPRYVGPPISPDGKVTVTVYAAPRSSKVKLYHSRDIHQVDYSITVDKEDSVLYLAYNQEFNYLSQGDSLLHLTKDTILYVRLSPFSDGNWVEVDKNSMELTHSHFINRNNGAFSPVHSNWSYFVLPCVEGEVYRVRTGAGQLAAPWYAASNKPDLEQKIRPKKVACSENKGIVGYVAEEFVIPAGAKYLIINSNDASKMMLEQRVAESE